MPTPASPPLRSMLSNSPLVLKLMDDALRQLLTQSDGRMSPATALGMILTLEALAQGTPEHLDSKRLSSLLVQTLGLASRNDSRPTHHAWPQRLGEAGGKDLSLYDAEFFAVLLMELGASPWSDVSKEHPLGTALPAAMGQLSTGLCERMWAVEAQRPPLDTLQESRPDGVKKSLRNWLDWASEHPQGDDLVRWLLKTGVRSAKGNHALAFASTLETFQAYQELDYLPTKDTEQKKVATAWESRLSKGELSATMVNQLKQALTSATTFAPPEENSAALSLIQNALSLSSWNRLERERSLKRHTAKELVQRAEVVRGTHAGTWSLLAALMLKEVRPCWTISVGRTDINWIMEGPLNKNYRPYTKDLQHNWSLMKGTLVDAKDFDWQPGISINGPLAISLSAYLDQEHHLNALCGALGIEEFWPWWDQNVVHAAAFSEALSDRLDNANARLISIWHTLLSQTEDLLAGNDHAALHLLRMYQRFHRPYSNERSVDIFHRNVPDDQVSYSLEGQNHRQPGAWFHPPLLATIEHKPLTVDWLVELALWEGSGQGPWATRLDQAANDSLLEKRHLERMRTHVSLSLKKAAKEDKASNAQHQKEMDHIKPWADRFSKKISSWDLATRLPKATTVSRKRF